MKPTPSQIEGVGFRLSAMHTLTPSDSFAARAVDWPTALGILRDAGAEINRLGPETSLPEALQLIAETAVRLLNSDSASSDNVRAVIYTYDATHSIFDPHSRVSAGEGDAPALGDVPRPNGVGALALARRARVLSYEEDALAFHPLKYQAGIRTAACYPLLVAGQPVGALYIDLRAARRFTPDELLILDTFVHLAAVAIYNTRQFEGLTRALQRKVDELERLEHAGRLIGSRLNLPDTLREILAAALRLTGAEHGSIRLLDKAAGILRLSAIEPASGAAQHVELTLDERGSVMGWVARHRQPARIDDLRQPEWASIYVPLHPEQEMRSELTVPLLGSGGGPEGVLNVESPRLAAFDADAQRTLQALATQAVIALQEAKLLEAIEAMSGQLIVRPPDELFALLLQRACDLLNVPHGAVWEMDRAAPQTLTLRASTGDLPRRYQVSAEGSLLGTAVQTGRPVISADMRADSRLTRRDLTERMGWVSALIVPLAAREGHPRGAFGVYTTEPRSFSDWDTRLLATLANHAAVALQQAEALAQVKLAEERQAVAETFAVLGDIAANLLHRVNNLIGLIPVHVQAIGDNRPAALEDGYVKTRLDDIEASARAALKAARETMLHLRPLRLQAVRVNECYHTAVERLTPPPQVEVAMRNLNPLPPVYVGEEQLRLILFNLMENALEAIGDQPGNVIVSGRVVTDALDRARRWVEVTVADTGPGVPPDDRERIFAPNFSTKRSLKKMGFGLWWVKAWVQRFGGSVALGEGETGCSFILRLPPAQAGELN